MNENEEVRELCALLKSRVPIILIEAHEEPIRPPLNSHVAALRLRFMALQASHCGS